MAMGGGAIPYLLAILLLRAVNCFNLEPRASSIYDYPYARTEGRESYFGFSVALQRNQITNTNWLMVGAPRANSSLYNEYQITEPGALFKCDLRGQTCEEFVVDEDGNTESNNPNPEYSYQDLKNYGWLGGSLDAQPEFAKNRQVTGVCAPRWKNQIYAGSRYMNGACYWFDESESEPQIHKKLPLVNHEEQIITIGGTRNFYHYGHGQAGMSIHFPEDQESFIVGAPGVFNWHGTIILFEDLSWINPGETVARRRRQIRSNQVFNRNLIPNPYYFSLVRDGDLFGYAVTSGKFLSHNKIHYVGGAPRGANSLGKVIVFDFPSYKNSDLLAKKEFKGEQMGEYFGAAVTAADINGDGLSDLVVGSPMYSLPNKPDIGKIKTFLSSKGHGLHIHSESYFGDQMSVGRFGTALASPGDLNGDSYEDIIVGAPWENNGAVYVFLGSSSGLKSRYSQRLSPEDFTGGLRGFGMSLSRGTDLDNNGYPDLAIGSFLSGHVAVIKARPVAQLSGYISANPSNVAWEGSATLALKTCLHYKGYKIPRHSSIQVTVTLDHSSPIPRAVFTSDNQYTQTFYLNLPANNVEPTCRTDQVTVKDNKIDPDQPISMRMEYELLNNPGTEITKQPMTDPGEIHSNLTRVGILKGCAEKTCKVDLMFDADLDLGKGNKLVVGQNTKPVLRVKVSNIEEPVYLPTMTVKVDFPLTLLLPVSHDCKFHDPQERTSLQCSLSNPIKKGTPDTVEVNVDASQLGDSSSNVGIKVDVTGEGYELKPNDNHLFMNLPLEANANLELYGHSKKEQVFYEHVGEDRFNATVNPRFTHTYLVVKKGPTPIGQVDLIIDIPVNMTDGQTLVKLYPPKTEFLLQPFQCTLSNGSFDIDMNDYINKDESISSDGDDTEQSASDDLEPQRKSVIVRAEKKADGPQYFNCSSGLMKCARLSCHIHNWPRNTESAKILLDVEIDLKVLAKSISINGGAVFMSTATASIQSLSSQLTFVGEKIANGKIVTYIQPDTLQTKGIPWWVILLAVLGGVLLLGLLAYGLYKTGFFRREKMEEMKSHRANISPSSYGATNPAHISD